MTNYLQGKHGHYKYIHIRLQMKEDSFAFSNVGAPGRLGLCRGGRVCRTYASTHPSLPSSSPKKKKGEKKFVLPQFRFKNLAAPIGPLPLPECTNP